MGSDPNRDRQGSAAGDGRDDGDGLAVGHRGVEALEEPHVVVGDEDVDEPTQAALIVEEALGELDFSSLGGEHRN